jgi:[protein-PII] uridylyltransferase
MIPEFQPVVGRVHHDIYHVYTVDAHSIACVDKLRQLSRGDLSQEFPGASRIAADMARPHCLFMACLLHDIGKDTGGRAHSERGHEMTVPILRRLGVQEHDIVEIRHLILKHLRMYHVASRRDVDDPTTINQFRDEVHGPEGLKELYLLTLCDVSTTSPSALTMWKRRMLEELYVNTLLSFEGLPKRSEARLDAIREATLAFCPDEGEADFLRYFLGAVPDRYLYANEPQEIVVHARMCRQAEVRRQMVDLITTDAPYAELGVVVDDRPGALAAVTAALSANRLRVVGAQLYSWVDRAGRKRVLDLFWVRSGNDPSQVKKYVERLEKDIEALMSGEVEHGDLAESRRSSRLSSRPSPEVETRISFDNRSASQHTVVEVVAKDRQGLLHHLSRALMEAKLEVGLAKINTEGNAVADVFYVVNGEGNKVVDQDELSVLEEKLKSAVQRAASLFDD